MQKKERILALVVLLTFLCLLTSLECVSATESKHEGNQTYSQSFLTLTEESKINDCSKVSGNDLSDDKSVLPKPKNEQKNDAQKTMIGNVDATRKRPQKLSEKTFFSALASSFGALLIVIGFFLGCVCFFKFFSKNNFRDSCSFVKILDRLQIGKKTELITVVWGSKLILLSSSSDKLTSISEISDTDEIAAMIAITEKKASRSSFSLTSFLKKQKASGEGSK